MPLEFLPFFELYRNYGKHILYGVDLLLVHDIHSLGEVYSEVVYNFQSRSFSSADFPFLSIVTEY